MGYLKLFRFMVERYDGANKMQIEQHSVSYSSNFSIFSAKKYHEETTELEKWQSEIPPEY